MRGSLTPHYIRPQVSRGIGLCSIKETFGQPSAGSGDPRRTVNSTALALNHIDPVGHEGESLVNFAGRSENGVAAGTTVDCVGRIALTVDEVVAVAAQDDVLVCAPK